MFSYRFPDPGYYTTRLHKGAIKVPVRVWLEDGDRDGNGYLTSDQIVRCNLGDKEVDPFGLDDYRATFDWREFCDPIEEGEYRFLLDNGRYRAAHDSNSPEANPRRAIDLTKVPVPTF